MRGLPSPGALTMVLVVSATSPVGAETGEGTLEAARRHFDAGQRQYLAGNYAAAAASFVRAYEARPYPSFLFNIAVCREKGKDLQAAVDYYQRFLDSSRRARDRAAIEARVAAFRRHLQSASSEVDAPQASLPPIEPKGFVVIESMPDQAAIYLNTRANGLFTRTPYTGSLPPGPHTVIIERSGYQPQRKSFVVRNDRLTYLFFGLSKAAPAASRPAITVVAAPPVARDRPEPFYRRWWFWTAVGLAVASVAASVAVVALRPQDVEPGSGTLYPGQIQLELTGRGR